jgi:hypothetical protein
MRRERRSTYLSSKGALERYRRVVVFWLEVTVSVIQHGRRTDGVDFANLSQRLGASCLDVSTPWGVLPRRFISSIVVVWRKFSSSSFKCLMASGRFLGRTCLCGAASVLASAEGNLFGAEASRTVEVGNRSGASCSAGLRPMA